MTGLSKGGTVWSFEYDQLGQRYAITENGSRREFLFDPTGIGSIVAEYSAGGTANYVQGYGLVSRVSGGTATYYDFDGLGSTVGLTDAAGLYVNTYSYLPFGEMLTSTMGASNPFTYVGRFGVLDVGNGLYQMRARDYSPTLGRFTTQDPIGIAGGGNLFAYTMNSPTNFVDVTGRTDAMGQRNLRGLHHCRARIRTRRRHSVLPPSATSSASSSRWCRSNWRIRYSWEH